MGADIGVLRSHLPQGCDGAGSNAFCRADRIDAEAMPAVVQEERNEIGPVQVLRKGAAMEQHGGDADSYAVVQNKAAVKDIGELRVSRRQV